MRIVVSAALLGLATLLAGCSATGFVSDRPSDAGGAFDSEIVGHGTHLVGIQVSLHPDNLSGGAANAEFLAARMALNKLTRTDVRVQISDFGNETERLIIGTNDLLDGGVEFIIAPRTARYAQSVADLMEGKTTVVATAHEPVSGGRVFSAGLNPGQQALAIGGDLSRRGAKSAVLAFTPNPESEAFVRLLQQALFQEGIDAELVQVDKFNGAIAFLTSPETVAPDALVFATPPDVARQITVALAADGRYSQATIFGPTDWALTSSEHLPAACRLPAPAGNDLVGFARVFRESYGVDPTLSSALVYDLAVMAGALPQVAEANPYAVEILRNPHGFSGVTGAFLFDEDGRAKREFRIVGCP